MAIDDRFAPERFRTLDPDNPQPIIDLIVELEAEIASELHPLIASKMAEVVQQLNQLGHQLSLDDDRPGSICYHDDATSRPEGEHCWLRVAADTTVSAGWLGIWSGSLDLDDWAEEPGDE